MNAKTKSVLVGWGRQLMSIVILLGLGAVGYWGHHSEWRFTTAHAAESSSNQSETKGPDKESVGAGTVRFHSPEAVRKSGIEVNPAKTMPIEQFITANGVVGYDQTKVAQLSAKVPGTVWRVEKKVGEGVKKGEVLAIIESIEVGKAKAEFLTSIANLDIKEQLLKILNPLTSVVATRQIKEAEAAVREARIRVFNSHQALVNLGLPISIAEASKMSEEALAKRVQFLGLPRSIADALDPETTTANLIPLVAPFDGVVLGRDVVVGEVVTPSQSQFTVADVNMMWITLEVLQEDAGKISIGQEVIFKLSPEGTGEVRSTVIWISTELDEKTRTISVRCDAPNPIVNPKAGNLEAQRLLHAHAFGTGKIRVRQKSSAVVVPNRSLQYDGSTPTVFIQRSSTSFEQRAVRIGITGEEFCEILEGVKGGERVATIGSHLLHSEILKKRIIMASTRG